MMLELLKRWRRKLAEVKKDLLFLRELRTFSGNIEEMFEDQGSWLSDEPIWKIREPNFEENACSDCIYMRTIVGDDSKTLEYYCNVDDMMDYNQELSKVWKDDYRVDPDDTKICPFYQKKVIIPMKNGKFVEKNSEFRVQERKGV